MVNLQSADWIEEIKWNALSEIDFERRVFLAQGSEFSYSVIINTRYTEYCETDFGFYQKPVFGGTKWTRELDYNQIIMAFPKGLRYSKIHEVRNPVKLFGGKVAYEYEYDILTITVPEAVSASLFSDWYYREANQFRNHILTSKLELLNRLINNEMQHTSSHDVSYFAVGLHYITTDPFDDDHVRRQFFASFGMQSLHSKGQQFGLLLAMIDLTKKIYMERHQIVMIPRFRWEKELGTNNCLICAYLSEKENENKYTNRLSEW